MSSFRCPRCGFINFASAESCRKCKTEFAQNSTHNQQNSYDSYPTESYNPQPNQWGAPPTYAPSNFAPRLQNFAGGQPNKLKSGLAIASFVMGCAGFVLCWGMFGLLSLPGLVIGIVALMKANKKPFEYGGKGFAVAGVVINAFLVLLIPIVMAISIPNLLASRRAANESSAISSMRTLLKAEDVYLESKGGGKCGDLTDLSSANLIDSVLASGRKSGYKFAISKKSNGTCEIFATPLETEGVAKTGTRSFYAFTDEWEIRAADKDGASAGKNDPMLKMLN